MSNSQEIEVVRAGEVTILSLGPHYKNLDEAKLERVRHEILAVVETIDPPLLILDLSHTEFFGSAFIEVLFRAWHRVGRRDDGKFAICGLTKYCKEILQVTNLDKLWSLYDTREDALNAISPEG